MRITESKLRSIVRSVIAEAGYNPSEVNPFKPSPESAGTSTAFVGELPRDVWMKIKSTFPADPPTASEEAPDAIYALVFNFGPMDEEDDVLEFIDEAGRIVGRNNTLVTRGKYDPEERTVEVIGTRAQILEVGHLDNEMFGGGGHVTDEEILASAEEQSGSPSSEADLLKDKGYSNEQRTFVNLRGRIFRVYEVDRVPRLALGNPLGQPGQDGVHLSRFIRWAQTL